MNLHGFYLKTKVWISSPFFCFFSLDFILSNLHYMMHNVHRDLPKYAMTSGDVEYWLWDLSWYFRIASLLLLSVLIGWTGYRATKKEITGAIIYMVIAFKDCFDYFQNHNIGTTLVDYTILFTSLTIVQIYFAWQKNHRFYEWKS